MNGLSTKHNAVALLEDVIERSVPGDVAEVGLLSGGTFKQILPVAHKASKHVYGFDSFEGMAVPKPEDFDGAGWCNYPEGKFKGRGLDWVIANCSCQNEYEHTVDFTLFKGWIPNVFDIPCKELNFAFAYLDVDHYEPTWEGLNWLWERIEIGGILLCDDYLPGIDRLATLAIEEWMKHFEGGEIIRCPGPRNQIAFRKMTL